MFILLWNGCTPHRHFILGNYAKSPCGSRWFYLWGRCNKVLVCQWPRYFTYDKSPACEPWSRPKSDSAICNSRLVARPLNPKINVLVHSNCELDKSGRTFLSELWTVQRLQTLVWHWNVSSPIILQFLGLGCSFGIIFLVVYASAQTMNVFLGLHMLQTFTAKFHDRGFC